VTEARLREFGLRTMGDVQRLGEAGLRPLVGEAFARHIAELAFGRDDRVVKTEYVAKSISAETTFDEDCEEPEVVRQVLMGLVEEVGARLREDGRPARTGHLKLRYEDFSTLTRQAPLTPPTVSDADLIRCAARLLEKENVKRPVRLVGFGVSGFTEEEHAGPEQLDIFPAEPGDPRQAVLDRTLDRLRKQYGRQAVQRASTLPRSGERH
jgi:nucleotidyltransferase/DNA polymerase involved in DNA repair